jgi:hypothetical protein
LAREEALEGARLWQFQPIEDKVRDWWDPRQIQRYAEENSSPERVMQQWIISADPQVHVDAIRRLVDAGATHVFIHPAQSDQRRFIGFYGAEVLPALGEFRRADFPPTAGKPAQTELNVMGYWSLAVRPFGAGDTTTYDGVRKTE